MLAGRPRWACSHYRRVSYVNEVVAGSGDTEFTSPFNFARQAATGECSSMMQRIREVLQPAAKGILLGLLVITLPGCIGRTSTSSLGPADTAEQTELPDEDQLRDRLDAAIRLALHQRRLNLTDHAAWQIIHGAMAFKEAFPIEHNGQLVSAIDYALNGGRIRGWDFEPGIELPNGRRGLRAVLAPGSKEGQGHPDQWLGYLAECGFPPDQTIVVGADTYTIADLIAQMEWDVPRNVTQEYSWTLMALSAYRPANYTWVASDGETWSIEKLVGIEAEHDLASSACGGCHRLFALATAVNRHLQQGGELTGGWQAAQEKIDDSIARAFEYQNPDGSFSSNYFERPGMSADLTQSLSATGHIFEFLTAALTTDELKQPAMQRAAVKICEILEQTKDIPLECGALYHAAHGLILYRQRLYGPLELELPQPAAGKQPDA